jgi:hypothetical protein
MAGEAGLVRALLWRVVGEEMLGVPLLLLGGRRIRGGGLPNPRAILEWRVGRQRSRLFRTGHGCSRTQASNGMGILSEDLYFKV